MSIATTAKPSVRPQGLLYAVDEWPPPARLALLGLQYGVMNAIYLVLVAIIIRNTKLSAAESVNIMGIACVALAIGTTLQALPRGPVGSGFLAPPVYSATYLAPSVLAAQIGGMPLVFGMTLVAGFMEIAVALSIMRLRIVITPVLSGLSVFIVGLQLGVVGIGQMLDVHHEDLPAFQWHLVVTILTLATCVGLSIWGKGALKLLCSMLGLVVGMVAAILLQLIPLAGLVAIGDAAWLDLPRPALLQYEFSAELLPAFLAAGVAAALRAVGVVTTCQRINDAAWRQPDMAKVRKGVLADGLANVIGGIIGAPGMSTAPSLVGISKATGATSRVIAFASSAVLLAIALSPRLAGLFLLVPPEVAGSLLVFTATFMISGGMEIMLSRPVDTRAIYVIGISTLLALSENVFPAYFHELRPVVRSLTGNPLAFGLTTAIVLTLLFRAGMRQRGETTWTRSGASMTAAIDFLRDKAEGWKVPAATAAIAIAQTQEIMAFFAKVHPLDAGGELQVSFNGLDLGIGVVCHGGHRPALPETTPTPALPQSEIENEEAAAFLGLRDFLRSLIADRKSVEQQVGRVRISFLYAV
jgi:xanthine permease XanP